MAKCRMGIGEDSFVKLLSSASSPKDALDRIEKKFVVGYHKAAKMAEVGLWAQTWAVTDLDPQLLESIFIRPFSSLQAALDAARQGKGQRCESAGAAGRQPDHSVCANKVAGSGSGRLNCVSE